VLLFICCCSICIYLVLLFGLLIVDIDECFEVVVVVVALVVGCVLFFFNF